MYVFLLGLPRPWSVERVSWLKRSELQVFSTTGLPPSPFSGEFRRGAWCCALVVGRLWLFRFLVELLWRLCWFLVGLLFWCSVESGVSFIEYWYLTVV